MKLRRLRDEIHVFYSFLFLNERKMPNDLVK